jgi:hypothetical protein
MQWQHYFTLVPRFWYKIGNARQRQHFRDVSKTFAPVKFVVPRRVVPSNSLCHDAWRFHSKKQTCTVIDILLYNGWGKGSWTSQNPPASQKLVRNRISSPHQHPRARHSRHLLHSHTRCTLESTRLLIRREYGDTPVRSLTQNRSVVLIKREACTPMAAAKKQDYPSMNQIESILGMATL